jgi:hypothetical protein
MRNDSDSNKKRRKSRKLKKIRGSKHHAKEVHSLKRKENLGILERIKLD